MDWCWRFWGEAAAIRAAWDKAESNSRLYQEIFQNIGGE